MKVGLTHVYRGRLMNQLIDWPDDDEDYDDESWDEGEDDFFEELEGDSQ